MIMWGEALGRSEKARKAERDENKILRRTALNLEIQLTCAQKKRDLAVKEVSRMRGRLREMIHT